MIKILVVIYLVILNSVVFISYGVDKFYAKADKFRINEKTLLIGSILGGSIGAILGSYSFSHKTAKWKFKIVNIITFILLMVGLIKFL